MKYQKYIDLNKLLMDVIMLFILKIIIALLCDLLWADPQSEVIFILKKSKKKLEWMGRK